MTDIRTEVEQNKTKKANKLACTYFRAVDLSEDEFAKRYS